MAKLLIIADDFTGAMDTGVPFAERGAATCVVTDAAYDFTQRASETDVLVINSETRHLDPKDAYAIVFGIVRRACAAGIPYIYKKTDSALRGNIGSELAAVMDAAGKNQLIFAPAFPRMNRITKNGIHYIEGTPVAKSVFGQDPFEPVHTSCLRDIIGHQTGKNVILHAGLEAEETDGPGIQVYDAQSDTDLIRIGSSLGLAKLHLCAGCAGFAAVLADLLELKGRPQPRPELPKALFVVCGSLNPVTVQQLDIAEQAGFPRIRLTPQQKLDPAWPDSADGTAAVREWINLTQTKCTCILDVNGAGTESTECYARDRGLSEGDVRNRIAGNLGQLIKRLLDGGLNATVMCTGGDTILALMKAVGVTELTPVCEVETGVVLTCFVYNGRTYPVISKSGGFGDPELLCSLALSVGVQAGEGPLKVHA